MKEFETVPGRRLPRQAGGGIKFYELGWAGPWISPDRILDKGGLAKHDA